MTAYMQHFIQRSPRGNNNMKKEYLAHISEDGREQTVMEHLENTAELCAGFAKEFGAEEQGYLIGIAHDIGKCSEAFQQRLHGGHIVDHASAGALECAKLNALWAACCVAGHHGGLPDVGNMRNDAPGEPTLFGRLQSAIHHLIPVYENPIVLRAVRDPEYYGRDFLTDSFVIRMLYSCLVDADFLDTEHFMSAGTEERGVGDSLSLLQEKLNDYISPWWNPSSEINKKRCEILRSCIVSAGQPQGLFTLTVPTGGGKTVASMAFALNHAIQHGMRRIIYVIPYTSIIEQTADVFRDIFGEDVLPQNNAPACFARFALSPLKALFPSFSICAPAQ